MKLTHTEQIIVSLHDLDQHSEDPGSHDATLDIVGVLEERPTPFNGTPAFQVAVALLLGYSIGRRAQLQAELYELRQSRPSRRELADIEADYRHDCQVDNELTNR